jgi:DNA polymerase elongation subunit (family B)
MMNFGPPAEIRAHDNANEYGQKIVGRYMSAVARFLRITNDISTLAPFVGRSVRDVKGTGLTVVQLDAAQHFLKILANSTSYGIFIELNVAELDEPAHLYCFGPTGKRFPISTKKIEEPGRYFHPLLATMITGAARLMLAITQTLALREGLNWVFCDTDSMALAKPEEMDEKSFHIAVNRVRDWFIPLNPYRKKGSLLKIEDANYRIRCGKSP